MTGAKTTSSGKHARAANLQVVWFKRDLRIDDHAPLALAARAGPVLPLFIAEPGLYAQPDAAGRHWDFAVECLEDLSDALAKLGQPLIVRIGDAVEILSEIHDQVPVSALWSHQETGNAWTFARDKQVASWCRENAIPWREPRQHGIVRRLTDRNGWAAQWDRLMAEPTTEAPRGLTPLGEALPTRAIKSLYLSAPSPLPSSSDLGMPPDLCPGRQPGGRAHALTTLYTFLHERGTHYRREMSSPVTAYDASSRLSPHLAWGTISMREAAQATYLRMRELKQIEQTPETKASRASLSSFSGRLHWHCHFMQKLETEPRMEFENLHRAYDGMRPAEPDPVRLAAWKNGETGLPLVDACMRALASTGWLNFRMRAMLMAVASYHLWLPWRDSGLHLARVFTDYEPGIHWPQVQMQSGTTGINTVRIYNPVKQSRDQDPDGAFIRAQIPELSKVPDAFIHEPWTWDGFNQIVKTRYPNPIVDHITAARQARERVWAVRRTACNYRDGADDIQNRHGSRKSGMRMTGPRKRPRQTKAGVATKTDRQSAKTDQLDLDL